MPGEPARAFAEGLAAAGVRRLFGVPGGGPNLDMIGAAEDLGIDFVLTHGETAACVMAAPSGGATGTPGVAVVTRGPGFTSAANGLAQATLDRFPLLLVSDAVPRASAAPGAPPRLAPPPRDGPGPPPPRRPQGGAPRGEPGTRPGSPRRPPLWP